MLIFFLLFLILILNIFHVIKTFLSQQQICKYKVSFEIISNEVS